jgi:Zn-dependent protease
LLKIPEAFGLIISWLVISISFSISALFQYPQYPQIFYQEFLLYAATAGVGFLLHELAHRTTARRYGCYAYYQIWLWGVVLTLVMAILTQGSFIFAALGAVYIAPMVSTSSLDYEALKKVFGIISLSGPAMNLLLVAIFYGLSFSGGYIGLMSYYGFSINLWLAAFNLIPVPPFDGSKIFSWSKPIWAAFAIPSWALLLLLNFL